ncbi:MAG TPA: four helix bundle protein [Desulfitobacteriaceae bacterium]|nr:four helix bundle protein [Desulfitobacteriaceae bacterium]
MKDNIIVNKSLAFAIRIVNLYKYLCEERKEYVLSKQLLRSGTSVGANVKEALRGQTKKDFAAKMNVALKEISETEYWLELLYNTEYITQSQYQSINNDCLELIKILTSIVKTMYNS